MNYSPLGTNPDITPIKQTIVFILTFLVYVGLHSMRAAWAYSKSQLSDTYHYAQWINGGVDVTYLLFYSAGMATIGTMTNKFRLNFYLAIGMFVAALGFSSFAIYGYIKNDLSIPLMFIGMAVNGYAQSTGWPGMMATMGNWFGKGRRGLLLAFWSVNANIGNIVGSVVCSFLHDWRLNVVVTAIISAAIGLLVIVFLKPRPKQEQGLRQSLLTEQAIAEIQHTNSNDSITKPALRSLNIFQAFLLPRVPLYVLGYAMLKGCVYGLLFWLPTYLKENNLQKEKGYISAMVDVGSLLGGMLVGHLGDIYKVRALFLSPLLFLGSVVMLIVSQALKDYSLPYYFLMFLIGLFTGGPYNVIGSAIAVDLGQQPMLREIGNGVSVISALVEGSAAVFSAISQILIPLINLHYMFVVFCLESFIATLALFPLFRQDLKILRKAKKQGMQASIQ